MVSQNVYGKVIAEGMGVVWVVGELKGFAGSRIVANQAFAEGGNPEQGLVGVGVGAVFSHRKNAAGEKRVGSKRKNRVRTGVGAGSVFFGSLTCFKANKFGQTGTQKAAGGALVESQTAAIAAHPQTVLTVNEEAADHIVRERGWVLRVVIVAGEGRGGRVEAAEAAANCADPDEAFAVASQAEDAIAADGGRIGWVVAIIFDTEVVFIEDIEPGAIGSNVEEAGVGFIKAANLRMGEAGLVERVGQEAHEILAVEIELADAAVSASPQDALGIKVERNDTVIGQGQRVVSQVAIRDKGATGWNKLTETAGVGADPERGRGSGGRRGGRKSGRRGGSRGGKRGGGGAGDGGVGDGGVGDGCFGVGVGCFGVGDRYGSTGWGRWT